LIFDRHQEWTPLLADPLEGVRSVGTVEWYQFTAGNGCEGTAALQTSTDYRCHNRMAQPSPWLLNGEDGIHQFMVEQRIDISLNLETIMPAKPDQTLPNL
jgi:hypothetical protein